MRNYLFVVVVLQIVINKSIKVFQKFIEIIKHNINNIKYYLNKYMKKIYLFKFLLIKLILYKMMRIYFKNQK